MVSFVKFTLFVVAVMTFSTVCGCGSSDDSKHDTSIQPAMNRPTAAQPTWVNIEAKNVEGKWRIYPTVAEPLETGFDFGYVLAECHQPGDRDRDRGDQPGDRDGVQPGDRDGGHPCFQTLSQKETEQSHNGIDLDHYISFYTNCNEYPERWSITADPSYICAHEIFGQLVANANESITCTDGSIVLKHENYTLVFSARFSDKIKIKSRSKQWILPLKCETILAANSNFVSTNENYVSLHGSVSAGAHASALIAMSEVPKIFLNRGTARDFFIKRHRGGKSPFIFISIQSYTAPESWLLTTTEYYARSKIYVQKCFKKATGFCYLVGRSEIVVEQAFNALLEN